MRSRRLILLLPGLLGASARNPSIAAEAAAAMGKTDLRGLRTLLSRADLRRGAGTGETPESLLFETLDLDLEDDAWPSAAVSAVADGAELRPEAWIRADPVHLEAGLTDLRFGDPRELGITREEAVDLCAAINEALEGTPGRIEPLAAARWYIGLERMPRLFTPAPSLAVGGTLGDLLPRGPDAPVWLRALTEIQMLLHDHRVNRAREERGRPVVNSVWLWGASRLPRSPEVPPSMQLWSDSELARGLGRVLGVQCLPLPCGAQAVLEGGNEDRLDVVYCDALHYALRLEDWSAWLDGLRRWEAQWFSPLRRALWSAEVASLRIESGGGIAHEVPVSARWRWWRRARPLPVSGPMAVLATSAGTDSAAVRRRADAALLGDPDLQPERAGRRGDC